MRVIAPRRSPTPPPGGSTARLPEDVVAGQLNRLFLFSLVSGGLWAIALILELFVFGRFPTAVWIELFGMLVAIVVFLYARFAPVSPQARTDAGLWLMLVNAAAVALNETWALGEAVGPLRGPPEDAPFYVSWIAIVILVTAMILPNTPRKMLAAALASASMGPLGVWLASLRGVAVPSITDTFIMYLANYTSAVVAVLPSRMFQGLGQRLREARELGNYELIRRLGGGGMGEVWLARHRLLARPAAVKLISPDTLGASSASETDTILRLFEQEAQATAALSSEHSVRLFDFGATDDGSFYYVMELLAGRDLDSLVREFGPFPAERALYLLRQVCSSLAEAHVKGLVHRDIKPANIFVCHVGLLYDFVKVLDFGLVQVQERDTTTLVMQPAGGTDRVRGTPGYMAPEVILRRSVDRRADIYGLGCVAYFMLTGQQVFQLGARSPMEALFDHVHASPVRPSARVNLPIPQCVDDLVLSCLAKDPDNRPQDATEILNLIDNCDVVGGWSSKLAQAWWLTHLPDLTHVVTREFESGHTVIATSAETR
jgi:serine/threonine protein kinase